jgi:polysaccharide export outer membrane protein
MTQQTDLSGVEVTSTVFNQDAGSSKSVRNLYDLSRTQLAGIVINPQDVVRLRGVPSVRDKGTVIIAGQVNYPGVFDINRNERLSSVLERAGGMTDVAYPYGAVFTRRSAAGEERTGNDRAAREIESQVVSAPSSSGQLNSDSISYLTTLAQRIRTAPALGRVTVTVDPAVLASHPELDIVLQSGDALFIPKRPSSVTVTGEVLNPGSFQYRTGLSAADYVNQAGGTSQSAEEGRIFIIRPDGSASPLRDSWLSFSDQQIPPGSTVVVPRDLRPFDWMQFLRDITQVTSQVAVTAASLSVINH